VYGYPHAEACAISVAAVREWLETHEWPREVVFCCYSRADAELYAERLGQVLGPTWQADEPRAGG
jgi:O-acetyl-ADP-ribose deacetylase (regulator of RNase III)